jgi:hypothetical protein
MNIKNLIAISLVVSLVPSLSYADKTFKVRNDGSYTIKQIKISGKKDHVVCKGLQGWGNTCQFTEGNVGDSMKITIESNGTVIMKTLKDKKLTCKGAIPNISCSH